MKKVAVIWSSPNVDGLTASCKNQFVKGLAEAGAEVWEIHLNKKKLDFMHLLFNTSNAERILRFSDFVDNCFGVETTLSE